MEKTASSKFLLIFLLSCIFLVGSSGSFPSDIEDTRAHRHESPSQRRELNIHTSQDGFTNPPFATYPTTPVTNPVTTPATGTTAPDTSTPPMITVPSANPVTAASIPPTTDPINSPFPATTFPGGQPTNPANPTGGGGVVAPPTLGNAPAVPGQSWCVARGGLSETVIQVALDYACGIGGADCSSIQQGASCYNPNSLENHASYAFNSYYQKNPVQTSCDFGGAAMVTNVNPSSGSCVFPTWSSSSAPPATVSPTTTDPTSAPTGDTSYGSPPIGIGAPPTVLGASNPAMGGGINGYGESPPTATISSASMVTGSSNSFIAYIVLALPLIIGNIGHDI